MITKDSSNNSDAMCWFSGMLRSFVTLEFARWLQKIVATVMRCAGFMGATCDVLGCVFWDATIFCNKFARWLQKIVATVVKCGGFQ